MFIVTDGDKTNFLKYLFLVFCMLEGILRNVGRIPFAKELTLATSILGLSSLGCSKDSNPMAPTTSNRPPETEVISYETNTFGAAMQSVKITVNGYDPDGVVDHFSTKIGDGEWGRSFNNYGKQEVKNGLVQTNLPDRNNHTIWVAAVDDDGDRDATPERIDYVFNSNSSNTNTTIPLPEQKYTLGSSGKVTISSTDGNDYSFTLIDNENKQPVSGLTLYYEEGIGGKIIMVEDPQKRYYSSLDVIVENSLLSSTLLAESSSFVWEFEKKVTSEFIEGVKTVKFIDVEVNMPESKQNNLEIIAMGVRADALLGIYENYDYLIKNKSVLNFVFDNTGYSWASKLGDFRQDFIENTDNMVYIMRELRQKVDPDTPMYDYVFDVYIHKTMGVLVHKARKVPVDLMKTSYLMNPVWGEDAKIDNMGGSESSAPDRRDNNYGADSLLQSGHLRTTVTYDSYFLMKFYLANYLFGRRIAKAELSLSLSDFNGWVDYNKDKFQLNIHNITSKWDENTVTWNNAPIYNENFYCSSEVYNISDFSNGGEVKIDISDLVKKWQSDGNYGILIDLKGIPGNSHGTNNVLCDFHGREHQDYKFWSRIELSSY